MYPRCPLVSEFFLAKFSKRGAVADGFSDAIEVKSTGNSDSVDDA